jgi:hypothetical protein
VRFVFPIPVSWSPIRNLILDNIANEALRATGFGVRGQNKTVDLLLVNEAEAAATDITELSTDIGLIRGHQIKLRVWASSLLTHQDYVD